MEGRVKIVRVKIVNVNCKFLDCPCFNNSTIKYNIHESWASTKDTYWYRKYCAIQNQFLKDCTILENIRKSIWCLPKCPNLKLMQRRQARSLLHVISRSNRYHQIISLAKTVSLSSDNRSLGQRHGWHVLPVPHLHVFMGIASVTYHALSRALTQLISATFTIVGTSLAYH
jgi:hypothetical protein